MRVSLLIFIFTFSTACSDIGGVKIDQNNLINLVYTQTSFGSRAPGTDGSDNIISFIEQHLEKNNWIIEKQMFVYKDKDLTNIIAKSNTNDPDLIIGTHFDTRAISDQDRFEYKQHHPVPGANDGASGTSVVLELSRIINPQRDNLWLVFFDGEDQGDINGWEWSIGSQYFAKTVSTEIPEAIIIDMIGDIDLNIFLEINSDKEISKKIWGLAKTLGYQDSFIPKEKYAMLDDHLPLINAGIPSILIIDFDYPYWHTTEDTIDKISPQSLAIITHVLFEHIQTKK